VTSLVLGLIVSLCVQGAATEDALRTRTLPGGEVETWHEVERDGGERVRHGPFRRTHPDGVTVAVEGDYGDGARRRTWKTFYPSGSRRSVGRYRRDERSGDWEFWHDRPGGEKRAEGAFEDGLRTGWWNVWNEDGSRDTTSSGYYRGIEVDGPRRFTVEYRHAERGGVELRHGSFRSYWEDGSPQMEGELHAGVRHGEWRFWHRNGMLDPEFVSGVYDRGRKVRALAMLRASDLPGPEVIAGLTPPATAGGEAARVLARRVAAWPAEPAPAGAFAPGRERVGIVLAELLALDLDDDVQRARAARLHAELLVPAAFGNAFLWLPGDRPDERARNRLSLMRWHALWDLTSDDPVFWEVELPNARAWERADPGVAVMMNPPAPRLSSPRLEGPAARWAPRFSNNKRRFGETRALRDAIDGALAWLAAHREADGSWQADLFETRCLALGHEPCGGAGRPGATTGVTGLALLAFLADGNTPFEGPHAADVRAGLRWLLAEQDAASGRIGAVRATEYVYQHAVATEVLCEALAFCDSALLRRAATRAVDFVLAGQNPGNGWRYDVPPTGKSDTSVTGWMTQALLAARDAGVPVAPGALDGARNWFHLMTDDATGRTGYTERGGPSARMVGENDRFPADVAEPLTSMALYSRLRMGDDPADVPLLEKSARVVLARLPAWSPSGAGTDMIAWYFGTGAMYEMGARRRDLWAAWSATLESVIARGQSGAGSPWSGTAGSWDPIGVWGFYGGRVYATALATLSLSVQTRSERVLD
jgi:hypothetical protein